MKASLIEVEDVLFRNAVLCDCVSHQFKPQANQLWILNFCSLDIELPIVYT